MQKGDVITISKELGKKWMFVGRLLELEDTKLDGIKTNEGDLQQCCIEMLMAWIQTSGRKATFKRLGEALCHPTVKLHKIAARYCTEQNGESPNGIINF